ncbi:hypothetical protein H6G97_37495 [Nostoc flagelliforme FACHB-838]|uniref:Uncharacterized protein n=1 Tax=Nostoc flagelliforme FACHB-838 TaxID=2692904 RepID=A0ABR8E2J2_9NOSO|nr:hypothetical protein [Nostoc flagelliforme FACHB-838]
MERWQSILRVPLVVVSGINTKINKTIAAGKFIGCKPMKSSQKPLDKRFLAFAPQLLE